MSYQPLQPPSSTETALLVYLMNEFANISEAFTKVESILLTELHREPDRPRDGMIILADGTNFNPGSGAGFYGRKAGAWVLLG